MPNVLPEGGYTSAVALPANALAEIVVGAAAACAISAAMAAEAVWLFILIQLRETVDKSQC
jgi:hypothetical protein